VLALLVLTGWPALLSLAVAAGAILYVSRSKLRSTASSAPQCGSSRARGLPLTFPSAAQAAPGTSHSPSPNAAQVGAVAVGAAAQPEPETSLSLVSPLSRAVQAEPGASLSTCPKIAIPSPSSAGSIAPKPNTNPARAGDSAL
jgi:hypothetical protein